MNLVIFGPPGAGKGTQSKFIVKKFNLYQLSTGDLLRNEIKNKTELGLKISSIMNAGELVSDDIVGSLIEIGMGKREINDFKKLIESRDRKNAGFSVPARGLFLTDIVYPKKIFKR